MKVNNIKGTVEFEIAENQKAVLCADWAALSELQTLIGEEPLSSLIKAPKIELLSKALEICCKKYSPEYTADKIKELSPPVRHSIEALDAVITIAYFGSQLPETSNEEEPKKN